MYGQFAFNSVPKEPPITRLLAYLSLHKTSLKPSQSIQTEMQTLVGMRSLRFFFLDAKKYVFFCQDLVSKINKRETWFQTMNARKSTVNITLV